MAIINAYHSPLARGRAMVPDSVPVRVLGPALAGALWRLSPETFSGIVLAPLARFRARHGLPAPRGDVIGLFGADMVLFPDADHFARTPGAPASHRRIGPLIWRPEGPGAGLSDLPAGFGRRRPLVYVCLGSSGDMRLLPAAVEGAAAAGADVLVATAGRTLARPLPRGERIVVRRYVDGDEASRRAALVVANGGNPQVVQAFAAGRPVLGLPSNLDQSLNMGHAVATGAARALHPARVTAARIARRVEALLEEPGPRVAAEGQAALIAGIDVKQRVAGALLPFL